MSATRMAAQAGAAALVALAAGCASMRSLVAEERWLDACARVEDPADTALLTAALVERLDASFEMKVIGEEQVRVALGEEGVAFAAARPLVATRVESRPFSERRAYDDYRVATVAAGAIAADGHRRTLAGYWIEPEPRPGGSGPSPWGDFARAMGALFSGVLAAPIEAVTLGSTSFGIRGMVEGAAGGAADAIDAADRFASALTAPAAADAPPTTTLAEALNRLLDGERCVEADGRRTCYSLRFLDDRAPRPAERDDIEVIFDLSGLDSGEHCYFGRRALLPLPPGATLAERVDLAFADGPRRLADLELTRP